MKAFQIKVDGKYLDYRVPNQLNLDEVKSFFSDKYIVKEIWQEARHVLGILEKNKTTYFLKLATTDGISATTKIDFNWGIEFNKLVARDYDLWVPKTIESGFYKENLFYVINEYFKGELLSKKPHPGEENKDFKKYIEKIIEFSETIQNLKIEKLYDGDTDDYHKCFFEKTLTWYEAVPQDIATKYKINQLLNIVENGYKTLDKKTRHGDFTPWHMIDPGNGKIVLIDGERALKNGVQYYDIGYLLQRIYTVLDNKEFAKNILSILITRGYDLNKLKVILAARAIGGFCDEVLVRDDQNYKRADNFAKWVLSL